MQDRTERANPAPPPITRESLSLGDVSIPSRFFLAPLAGYTGLAYRSTIRSLGGLGLATTDLVNARSLIENRQKSLELTETDDLDRPVAMQIYGASTAEMDAAARRVVELGATIVDINMGCPVRKVVKSGGGSALMCQVDAAISVVDTVVKAAGVPVTVKMRLGWDSTDLSAPALAAEFEKVGVAAVIIHGRTRQQAFRGVVDRDGIRAVVEAVRSMPVVGNGDIRTIADAERMFRETGCAAISIGRGALGNPFIFRQLEHWSRHGEPGPSPTFSERVDVMHKHFHSLLHYRGERMACLQFRKVLKWYSHFIRPRKELYHRLINLPSAARFDEVVEAIREAGPSAPLPGHFDPKIPVPSGPIEHW